MKNKNFLNNKENTKILDEKNIYEDYMDLTIGTEKDSSMEKDFSKDFLLFGHLTNPTKSKYDNIVGFLFKI